MTPAPASLPRLLREAADAWFDDRCASLGAALAYYTLFSLAPMLLIVVAVAGLVFGEAAARDHIFAELAGVFGGPTAAAVQEWLAGASWPQGGARSTVIGVALMLAGATSVFAELQSTLDHIWQTETPRPTTVRSWLRARLISFGLLLGLGFLLVVSLLVSAGLAAVNAWWGPALAPWAPLADWLNQSVALALTTAIFAMIYKLMPSVRIAWRDVWLGALVTAALFALGRHLIALYIGRAAVGSSFGAAGSVVVVLAWVYYSAQIFLFGAKFTWVVARQRRASGDAITLPRGAPAVAARPIGPAPGPTGA